MNPEEQQYSTWLSNKEQEIKTKMRADLVKLYNMKEPLFNLEKLTETQPVKYFIGTDTYDERCLTYCFVRKIGERAEVLLSKRMGSREAFKKEVENLARYFNATITNG